MAKYRLLGKLAKGGMAEVILAEAVGREGFKKKLVIKRILPHLSDDESFVQMFLQEARLAAQLTHPNVVQIFDLGQFGEQPFISMEYVDGRNLRQVLSRAAKLGQRLPVDVIVKIVALACEALAYAHELEGESGPLNLIHRDVSPENIMISRGGIVKLVDFGIAKASNSSKLTQAGAVRGKANYLAPEQVLGKALDGRADLFALCVVLYEALSGGAKPFRKTNQLDLMRAVAFEPHTPLREAQPDLPEALVAIVEKGLAKSPDDRWPNCRSLAGELERFLVQKGSYVPASAIADAVAQIYAGEVEQQPTPLPPEEVDGDIHWTEAQAVPAGVRAGDPTPPAGNPAPGAAAPAAAAPQPSPGPEPMELSLSDIETIGGTPPSTVQVASAELRAAVPSVQVSADLSKAPGTAVEPRPEAAAGPASGAPAGATPGKGAQASRGLLFAGAGALLVAVGVAAVLLRPAPEPTPVKAPTFAPLAVVPAPRPAEPQPATPVAAAPPAPTPPPAPEAPVAPVAPPAAPVATTGSLSVDSTVAGEVTVDGEKRGATPLLLEELAPGRHEVEVRVGSLGLSRKGAVEVVAGQKAEFRATFGKGTLVVRAKPFARVTVDGRSYGVTPIEPIVLLEGSHRVELVYDGGGKPVSRTKSVRIRSRAETKVTEIFE